MTDPQPRYAPGDHVLIPGQVDRVFAGGELRVVVRSVDGPFTRPLPLTTAADDVQPAAPAPTPTGWTAVRKGSYMVVRQPGGEAWSSWPDSFWREEGASSLELDIKHGAAAVALLTLRAHEAIAAAGLSSVEDDRVERAVRAAEDALHAADDIEDIYVEVRAEVLRDLVDAHRASGSTS